MCASRNTRNCCNRATTRSRAAWWRQHADAAAETEPVLAHARKTGWAVAHSRIVFADDASDANVFAGKVPALLSLTERSFNSEIISGLSPADGELVVRKTLPSALFGTGLAPWLTTRSVQPLLVAGATTSGCVRASVVDAMCHGFRPIVLSECVGDRSRAPHEASLFDMSQKYAYVKTFTDVAGELGISL